jgi:hypothetical protein
MLRNDALHAEGMCERDRLNVNKFKIWAGAFAVTFIVAIIVLGPSPGGFRETSLWMWALVFTPFILGIVMVQAYVKFLLEADELIKKIHLEALAIGCGTGIIIGTGFALFSQLLGSWEDAGAFTWAAIVLAFSIGLNRATKRYNE